MEEKAQKATFQFKGFEICESTLTKKENCEVGDEFNLTIIPRGQINREKLQYTLTLTVLLQDAEENFSAEVKGIGHYGFKDGIDEEMLNNYFYVNAPAILFPYLRAYISTLTNLSGYKTVTMPTINLVPLKEQLMANTTEL